MELRHLDYGAGRARIMFLTKLLSLFDRRQKRQAVLILLIMMVISTLEAIGIGAVIPLMTALAEPKKIPEIPWLHRIYVWSAPSTYSEFVVFLSLSMLVLVLIKNLVIGLSYRRQYRFVYEVQNALSNRLLTAYLHAPYQYFLRRNTAELLKNIQAEIPAFSSWILIPGLMFLSESVITLTILALLLIINATLTIVIGVFLSASLTAIFYLLRRRTDRFGRQRRVALSDSFRLATNALSAMKDIKVLGRQKALLDDYAEASRRYNDSMVYQTTMSAMPRLTVEVLAFIALVTILLYSVASHTAIGTALPLMALFAMAAMRLVPSFNRIFMSSIQLRYHTHTLDAIHNAFEEVKGNSEKETIEVSGPMKFGDKIEIINVNYSYPRQDGAPAVTDVSMVIEKGKSIGLVGPSGSGKTTLVDILLGLLDGYGGEIRVDGQLIGRGNIGSWQRQIGYIPQQIYLSDNTIAANIAFGVPLASIDLASVERAAEIAQLSEFVSTLPQGLGTEIGERGIRLSGGQRQRIGIARALYHNPEVLVMDEATSALDGVTEGEITRDIEQLSGSKTLIIIAHRLTTVERCDKVYLMERGKITGSGTYSDLARNNAYFLKLFSKQPVGG